MVEYDPLSKRTDIAYLGVVVYLAITVCIADTDHIHSVFSTIVTNCDCRHYGAFLQCMQQLVCADNSDSSNELCHAMRMSTCRSHDFHISCMFSSCLIELLFIWFPDKSN
jgi:hypothetical protein